MQLCDIGVNITNGRFRDDAQQVVQDAMASGVSHLIFTGTDEAESQQALELARVFPSDCYSTAGVHPHDAKSVSGDWLQTLSTLLEDDKCVAVGECGLDFNRNYSPQDTQIEVFSKQLDLAQEHSMPLFLHERNAFDTQVGLLKELKDLTGVAHCFTGDEAQLRGYLDLGLYVGITGWICDDKRGGDLQNAIQYLPLDRLLLETDAPFLTPKSLSKKVKRNEPKYLITIAEKVAEIKQCSVNDVAEASYDNARHLFGI